MFQYNCCIENNSNISEKYNFNKGDYSACRDLLGAVDWNICMDELGISESWAGFAEVIFDAIRNFIPVSKARSDSGKRYPTISHECKDAITDKHRKWKRYKNCKNVSNFNKYKQARNCV